MALSQDVRKVLLFLNRSLGFYMGYMGLRALWALLSLSVISFTFLVDPAMPSAKTVAGALLIVVLYLCLRWFAGRMEKRMMIQFRDYHFPAVAEPGSDRSFVEEDSEEPRSGDECFLAELAGHPLQPERIRAWRRERRMLRFRNGLVVLLILVPFMGLAFALTMGLPIQFRLFAILAATFLGGGFSGGLLTPVFSLLLVQRMMGGDH